MSAMNRRDKIVREVWGTKKGKHVKKKPAVQVFNDPHAPRKIDAAGEALGPTMCSSLEWR